MWCCPPTTGGSIHGRGPSRALVLQPSLFTISGKCSTGTSSYYNKAKVAVVGCFTQLVNLAKVFAQKSRGLFTLHRNATLSRKSRIGARSNGAMRQNNVSPSRLLTLGIDVTTLSLVISTLPQAKSALPHSNDSVRTR